MPDFSQLDGKTIAAIVGGLLGVAALAWPKLQKLLADRRARSGALPTTLEELPIGNLETGYRSLVTLDEVHKLAGVTFDERKRLFVEGMARIFVEVKS